MTNWTLTVITDCYAARSRPLIEIVRLAIAGGATVVQLREKSATTRAMVELGHALHLITQAAGVPLIVNDRLDVALAINAEGVHVGQADMPAATARRLLGPAKILGVSARTVEEAMQAEKAGADYLGVGDLFGTSSKPDAGAPLGLDALVEIVGIVSIPTVGIGGITLHNAPQVMRAGAVGVAVISAIMGAEDVEKTTRQLRTALDIKWKRMGCSFV